MREILAQTTIWRICLIGLLAYECFTFGHLSRKALRYSRLLFIYIELAAIWLVRQVVQPRFRLLGDCHECGDCCRSIIGTPPNFIRKTRLMKGYLLFHRLAHRFNPRAWTPDGSVVFECGHLQTDGKCGIYRFRPLLCRNYPIIPFFHTPGILPNCSFQIAPTVVAKMKSHPRLPIVNPKTAVHHPSPTHNADAQPEDFELVDTASPFPTPGGSQETRATLIETPNKELIEPR